MKIRFLLGYLLFFVAIAADAGIVVLSGTYQGKNIYVQNPSLGADNFCVTEVLVNDIKVNQNIKSSAFEIDLSHLKMNDPVTIKLIHKDECKPKILNPQVIKSSSSFTFNSFQVTEEHMTWSTKGEKKDGKMIVEHFLYNSWQPIKELPAKGGVLINNYDIDVRNVHHSSINKYRIKYVEPDGQVIYSNIVEYTSKVEKVTFYPTRVSDKITLSREADYEVLDAYGTSVKKGRGKEIDISNQPSGVYYLNVDNQTNKIYKK
ncbi:MAG: T9SS type A sorting domain-containing protein [Cytophagaceae bacterium]|nr:T9SS type A sorting domain-containing protein [Cytophagaceae bacterium]MDW8455385.1 T9SS type A sorting domain-containing protein [Cytophagaceae bacterium]